MPIYKGYLPVYFKVYGIFGTPYTSLYIVRMVNQDHDYPDRNLPTPRYGVKTECVSHTVAIMIRACFVWFDSLCFIQQFFTHVGIGLPEKNQC